MTRLAVTTARLEFTDRWNALRIVGKPAGAFVWAHPASADGRIRLDIPQTGLTAYVRDPAVITWAAGPGTVSTPHAREAL